MTDSEMKAILTERLASLENRILAACQRVARARSEVTLVAVTKTLTLQATRLLPELGLHDLGESRPQTLWEKAAELPELRWHFIGHLQRNKLERTLPLAALVHSFDSERLLRAANDFAQSRGIRVRGLLQVNASRESTKGGFSPDDVPRIVRDLSQYSHLEIVGLMTMAAPSDDPEASRPTFRELRQLRDEFLPGGFLSMGMSDDFEIAIEEGSTHIRIGTTLVGGLESETDLKEAKP